MGMAQFSFEEQFIKGLILVTPFMVDDDRGFFKKVFEKKVFEKKGIDLGIAEVIENSSRKGVLRGLHRQYVRPQGKLVRVAKGKVFDVAVDLRKDSLTFGKYFSLVLSGENKKMLYIPEGCLHGFLALEEDTIFNYWCSQEYLPQYDGGVRWNDPDLNIDWPEQEVDKVILSEKDKSLPLLKDYLKIIGD